MTSEQQHPVTSTARANDEAPRSHLLSPSVEAQLWNTIRASEGRLRLVVIVGGIQAGITLLVALALQRLGMLLDFVMVGALTYGIHRRSRTAAIFMVVVAGLTALLALGGQQGIAFVVRILFVLVYVMGITAITSMQEACSRLRLDHRTVRGTTERWHRKKSTAAHSTEPSDA